MQLLYWFEKIRIPGLNELMLAVTVLGEETAFLVLALIVFWCVDKKRGYYLMSVGFLGTMINQALKLCFRIPRPWVRDPSFTILEQARAGATGYSFPSGHTQSAVGTFGSIAASSQRRWVKWVCVFLAILVGISRMYVGVHTPWDVLVSACVATILVFTLKNAALKQENGMKYLLAGMFAASVALLLFTTLYPFPADVDEANLLSGMKNANTMLGCTAGVAVVYVVERKYVRFSEKAVWWAQMLKVVLGLGLVLLVKEGLRSPLDALFAGHLIARAVRYFFVVLTAGILWPLSFQWFSGLGQRTTEGKP